MKAPKLISLMVLLFFHAAATTVFAQGKPQAGDTISGIISDKYGPAMMVNVTERDSSDSVVAHSLTDFGGYFSFRLVNPENRISIKYVGYETVDIPIDTTFFEIKMKEWDNLPQVEMNADSSYKYKGIPIPLREAAKSVDTIDISEFENLGIYSIDELFNTKMRLDLP